MGDIELKQIQVFIAVVQSGGLTAAQARLGMGCPAISKHLSDLEARTRLTLCSRGRAGFQLTEAGERFYHPALSLQETWQAFKQDVASLSLSNVPKLRLATVDATLLDPRNPLPVALNRIRTEFANVQVSLRLMTPGKIADGILKQQLDLGVSFQRENTAPLQSELLYQEHLCLVAKKELAKDDGGYAFGLENWLSLAQEQGLVSFKTSQQLTFSRDKIRAKITCIPQQVCCDNIEEILWQALLTNRVGLVPAHVLTPYRLQSLGLATQDLNHVYSGIYTVYRKDKTRAGMVHRLLELLRQNHS